MNKIKLSILTIALSVFVMSCTETETTEHGHDHSEDVQDVVENIETLEVVETIAKDVNAEEFKSLFENGEGILVDVRTPGEVANGTISGSINIDFNSGNFDTEISELDKDVPVYLFCASGGRSGSAMGKMKGMGYKEVYNLIGGYSQWPNK